MKPTARALILGQFLAVAAVLLGSYILAFAEPNAQGCDTKLRVYDDERGIVMYCIQTTCANACSPATLTSPAPKKGKSICSCDGSTSYGDYVDGSSECIQTQTWDVSDPENPVVTIHCHTEGCTGPNSCQWKSTDIMEGSPPAKVGEETACVCN